ncbi:single-stranded DNA-binding protein [Nocardia shimofusensis]|uniref:single-stranded DNA-binding protein n=1 Tax=Nocardia shimofusensis TaxID=228596 RepID=UPI0008357334|nr:single-stranded DNA-binding protein [Nocardia shimofusensis]
MTGEPVITVIGNLTSDPELRFTPAGVAVANITVASTPRVFDRNSNEWKDSDALFLRCNIWREAAENVAESLTRGSRVIVSGRLKQRSYEARDGEKRVVFELDVEEMGPSLRFAKAKVTRVGRNGSGNVIVSARSNRPGGGSAGDPWGSAETASAFVGAEAGVGGGEPGF